MPSSKRKGKVFWQTPELNSIVLRAVEIQEDRPDLSGLSLLRAAQLSLPEDRRRRIVALTQVPWFEASILAEIKRRRDIQSRATDPIIPLIKETTGEIHAHKEMMTEHTRFAFAWMNENLSLLNQLLAVMTLVERQLRSISDRIGHPVDMDIDDHPLPMMAKEIGANTSNARSRKRG